MRETKVVADEEVVSAEEPEVEETEEEPVAEEEVSEEAVEETEASSEESFNLESTLTEIRNLLVKLQPAEETAAAAEASEQSVEEVDEVTALKARISELETRLDEATKSTEAAKASLVGFERLVELEKAGVKVDDSSKKSRIQSLASMTEETWKVYINDIKIASETSTATESGALSTASLILESDDEDAPTNELTDYRQKAKAFWQRG